jgi:hypothetical protein
MQNHIIELEKELKLQHNSKENIIKISMKDPKGGVISSRNILNSYKSIGLNNGGQLKLLKP